MPRKYRKQKKILDVRNVLGAYAIETTQRKWVLVSPCDLQKVSARTWHYNGAGKTANDFYAVSTCPKPPVKMHRYILNPPKGMEVDHINGIRLDNRRENLRVVTHTGNMQNVRLSKQNRASARNVCWYERLQKWGVIVTRNRKRTYLGLFATVEEAVQARDSFLPS